MTVFVKNKLVQGGRTTGYTISADGIERVYSVREAVQLVHTAESSNVFIVRDKESRLRMNDNDIKAKLRYSHLRAKTGKLPIITPADIKKRIGQSIMIESERLIFRKITADDFDDLAVMFRDPDVMTAWEHTFSDEQIQKWIGNQISRYQKDGVGYFAAIRKETGEFVGQMGLLWSGIDELRVLEIGYMLKRQYWGMGYATEGTAAFMQYAFTEIGLDKVYTSIRPENKSSIRVAERIGMKAEGSCIKQYNSKDMEHTIYSKERS